MYSIYTYVHIYTSHHVHVGLSNRLNAKRRKMLIKRKKIVSGLRGRPRDTNSTWRTMEQGRPPAGCHPREYRRSTGALDQRAASSAPSPRRDAGTLRSRSSLHRLFRTPGRRRCHRAVRHEDHRGQPGNYPVPSPEEETQRAHGVSASPTTISRDLCVVILFTPWSDPVRDDTRVPWSRRIRWKKRMKFQWFCGKLEGKFSSERTVWSLTIVTRQHVIACYICSVQRIRGKKEAEYSRVSSIIYPFHLMRMHPTRVCCLISNLNWF